VRGSITRGYDAIRSVIVLYVSRLLEFLEILQNRPFVTGAEAARELHVDVRTVRRYVQAVQELGFPVEGERGPAGGYRLRPGYKLPPLMFSEDEAAAVVLGLMSARRLGVPTSDDALAKINRVLPARLRARTESLEQVAFTSSAGTAPAGETVLMLVDAAQRRRRVTARYTSHGGAETERELSPYGVVVHGGRWYLAAYDHGREALRTFRVDRMRDVEMGGAARSPDGDFDAVAHVIGSFARVPWTHEVVVELEEPRDVPLAQIEGTRLTMRVESLDYMARVLASLDTGFTVIRPPELNTALNRLATRLARPAAAPTPPR
jgi:predicted DNA-binding transcriptional regulator YafY